MTEKIKKAIKEVLWDSDINPGGFDRLWAERRAVEGMGYYDLM